MGQRRVHRADDVAPTRGRRRDTSNHMSKINSIEHPQTDTTCAYTTPIARWDDEGGASASLRKQTREKSRGYERAFGGHGGLPLRRVLRGDGDPACDAGPTR